MNHRNVIFKLRLLFFRWSNSEYLWVGDKRYKVDAKLKALEDKCMGYFICIFLIIVVGVCLLMAYQKIDYITAIMIIMLSLCLYFVVYWNVLPSNIEEHVTEEPLHK